MGKVDFSSAIALSYVATVSKLLMLSHSPVMEILQLSGGKGEHSLSTET